MSVVASLPQLIAMMCDVLVTITKYEKGKSRFHKHFCEHPHLLFLPRRFSQSLRKSCRDCLFHLGLHAVVSGIQNYCPRSRRCARSSCVQPFARSVLYSDWATWGNVVCWWRPLLLEAQLIFDSSIRSDYVWIVAVSFRFSNSILIPFDFELWLSRRKALRLMYSNDYRKGNVAIGFRFPND